MVLRNKVGVPDPRASHVRDPRLMAYVGRAHFHNGEGNRRMWDYTSAATAHTRMYTFNPTNGNQTPVVQPDIDRLNDGFGFLINSQMAAKAVGMDQVIAKSPVYRPPLLNPLAPLRISLPEAAVRNMWLQRPVRYASKWTNAELVKNWCTQADISKRIDSI